MSQIGVPSLVWREIFACLGAVFIGGTAWTRLTVFTETRPLEFGHGSRERSSTGSHSRSASAMILRHPPVEHVGADGAPKRVSRARARGSRDLPRKTSMRWR